LSVVWHARSTKISQGSGLAWEDKLLLIEGLLEKVEELSAEDDAERFDTEEEVFTGGNSAVLIEREHSFWEQAMVVRISSLNHGSQTLSWVGYLGRRAFGPNQNIKSLTRSLSLSFIL